jgi:UDPglucose 6-dehydrogenase
MPEAQRSWFNPEKNHLFERITYHNSAKEAIAGSDAVFISTDWEEFRGLSRTIETAVKPPYLVIDGRRMIADFEALVERGYDFMSVGGALLRGSNPHRRRASDNGLVTEDLAQTMEKHTTD